MGIVSWIWIPLAIFAYEPKGGNKLQIVSDVYKKQPYIQVPTPQISHAVCTSIIKTISEHIGTKWNVQVTYLMGKWVQTLKCHPAVSIGLSLKQQNGLNDQSPVVILLIYPKDYRGLIEDPFAKNPPPISYLGSTRRLAFYCYPKNKMHPISAKIIESLKLQ
jgi:hypothetical protein